MDTRKIYTFCNLDHHRHEEYVIKNHPIVAMDDTGLEVGYWVSSDHSFGKTDILSSLTYITYPHEVEWVDNPATHPIVSELLK